MSASVIHVNDSTFDQEVLQSTVPVVVDFWAEWCGPCRMLAPVLEDLATDYGDQVRVAKLNVDENRATAGQFGIMSIPSLGIFRGGKPVNWIVGFMPKQELKSKIDAAIA
ncbi:MAG: thioredoxin [Bacillota bacterium]